MKLSRKLILTLALVLSVAMATTGTLAYLTDRESNANVFEVGNVDIVLEEDYNEPSVLVPNVQITKKAYITNVGRNSAYVWGTVAVPVQLKDVLDLELSEDEWEWPTGANFRYEMKIGEEDYFVYTGLYQGNEDGDEETDDAVLYRDGETSNMLSSVTLDKFVDIDPEGNMYLVKNGTTTDLNWNVFEKSKPVIYVSAYAIQSEGVDGGVKGAYKLYNQQWGNPANGNTAGVASPADNEFVVANSYELTEALNTIRSNEEYWNKDVVIKLASANYDGDFDIYQYPEWNDINGGNGSGNSIPSLKGNENVTHITIVGTGNATFTGNVNVHGWGNAKNGFENAKASTVFQNIVFDGENIAEANGDTIVVYAKAAANDVTFGDCEFRNATHISVGGSGDDAVGTVTFNNCIFNDGGCISGYAETLIVNDPTVSAATNGFISNQKAGSITVNRGEITCSGYAFRTQNERINIEVNDSKINVIKNDEGEATLVVFRGDGSHTATFNHCELKYDQENTGSGTLTIQ